MSLHILLIDSKQSTIDDLSTVFQRFDSVEVVKVDRAIYTLPPPSGLDAIFLILPAAEKWGAKPIPGRAQVLQTSSDDQQKGMPPYVVTGVVLRPEDPRGSLPETRLLLKTACEAIQHFNQSSNKKIKRLGFWAMDLLKGVTPQELVKIFSELDIKD